MPKTDPQLGIRLPEPLKRRLRRAADANRRSMNSEIIVLLERALPENEKAEVAVTTPAQ
ncbi:Arc family DNA-binding protein [Devosia sp. 1635]|uniref:Arc family DNA-binding protein n=1 Tax=Devosia sp. 1635 TaxID=2726066 RepID=UPI0015663839|nr:Arc family DNA-binding protein [Devosia sp. 1635]